MSKIDFAENKINMNTNTYKIIFRKKSIMKKIGNISFYALFFLISTNNAMELFVGAKSSGMTLEEQARHPVMKNYLQDPAGHINYPQCLFEALNYPSSIPLNQSCAKCHMLVKRN